ncbi:laminin subunit gamma-1-like [Amphiura filiformis]|uniref:laminin subunit gamma-1-like n=1 Tax=Amphiura filiformis TaxID=82378 RepID=UPI003B20ED6E
MIVALWIEGRWLERRKGILMIYIYHTGQGFLDNVQLGNVQRAVGPGSEEVMSVELCTHPEGFVGQFNESCLAGYRRDPPNSTVHLLCVCHASATITPATAILTQVDELTHLYTLGVRPDNKDMK